MGSLRILDPKVGDIKLIWDSENEDEVELAKEQFKKARKKGFTAFEVEKKGKKGERIDEFDPEAERIIMIPPVAGG